MKNARHKKVLGIAVGERSLLLAELSAGEDKPSISRLGEMPFPNGVTITQPEAIGTQLASYLRQQQFAAKHAVVGLPARWIVAQAKEVPAVDEATLSNILRLQAEAEFSTELKDLIYDYAGDTTQTSGGTKSILLAATPRRYLDVAEALCAPAKLSVIAVTPSAMALGEMTSGNATADSLVLAIAAGSAEMTAQRKAIPTAIRHLRAPTGEGALVNELRRVVSTMPADSRREMFLWDDTGVNPGEVGEQLGVQVHSADLSLLGVRAEPAASNGQGRKFAAAVALSLLGMHPEDPAIDFAHSRLAPPKEQVLPRWAIGAIAGALVVILLIVLAFHSLNTQEAAVQRMSDRLNGMDAGLKDATTFVSKVSFAQAWHGGDPRYLAAIRDITMAISDDSQTYATGLTLREVLTQATASNVAKPPESHALTGTLSGKTTGQDRVQALIDRMRQNKSFEPKLGGTDAGKGHDVTFSIIFTYTPAQYLAAAKK